MANDDVLATDETVRTADDTTDVEPPAEAPEGIVTTTRAVAALVATFGVLLDADYVPGKTLFRDALCERFELSLAEGEDLCDELEAASMIRFVEAEDGTGWHVHAEAGVGSGA